MRKPGSKGRGSFMIALTSLALLGLGDGAGAEPVAVRLPQGSAHGFVDVTSPEGKRIAVGDLTQRMRGDVVTSRLVLRFFDGSVDDETTVFSQRKTFRFISDHHLQHGPSFPKSMEATVDAARQLVSFTDEKGKVTQTHVDMPDDVYNGMASTLLMNVAPSAPETRIAVVVAGASPRVVHLSMKPVGEVPFSMGGMPRRATDFDVHVELGGVAGVVAPLVGKQPLDYHVLLVTGADPAFIREEGQLYEGGPLWKIQQISATLPK